MKSLLLASSSPYRRRLLKQLGLPFESQSPGINETPQPNETPEQLVERLAIEKALALGPTHPEALIIGSDQVAVLDGTVLGKPRTFDRARTQLSNASGRTVDFFTGLCLYNPATEAIRTHCEPFRVHFRDLLPEQISHYLQREQPYECAGSFKMEGLGISLFRKLEGNDPNALIGLPLISLVSLLREEGIDPLD